MEAVVFMLFAAAVAVVGIGIGLAVAPRLGRWDERHNGAEADAAVEREGEIDRE
jgi:hypothetical protein